MDKVLTAIAYLVAYVIIGKDAANYLRERMIADHSTVV